MRTFGRRVGVLSFLLLSLAGLGCESVRPWERELLARPEMAWEPDPLDAALHQHIHFSKEGSLDGGSAGGGGCGCN